MEKQMNKKPIYKVSATLVNSWLYYLRYPTDEKLEEFKELIRGNFVENEYVLKGRLFEQSVFDGKEGKLSEVVKDTLIQQWGKPLYISFPSEDFSIRLSGKADSVDNLKNRIYDIKRTGKYNYNNFSDSSTCQHSFYFKIFPNIKDFYYLIAEGRGEEVDRVIVEHKQRPSEEDLNRKVMDYITGVLTFVKEIGMWEEFKTHQRYKGAY